MTFPKLNPYQQADVSPEVAARRCAYDAAMAASVSRALANAEAQGHNIHTKTHPGSHDYFVQTAGETLARDYGDGWCRVLQEIAAVAQETRQAEVHARKVDAKHD